MIQCEICGHQSKFRLIEHIQKIHKMEINEYKSKYGEVVSSEYKEKVRLKAIEKWKDNSYREKTMKSRDWIYQDDDVQNRRKNSIIKYYENGGKVWNDGLNKENDERLLSIGNKNKKNLSGRTKEEFDYLKKHSERMSFLWNNSEIRKKWVQIQQDPKSKEDWKNKISETITNKILNGEITPFSSFKCGWYENTKGKFWYSSLLEMESMMLMDKLNIEWSNNHKIKIKYIKDNIQHYYIPDFLIKLNNKEYVIEMKGFDWDGNTDLKSECARKHYNYHVFYNVDDLDSFIKEQG